MKTITILLLMVSFNSFSQNKIVGGTDLSKDHQLSKSTVALIYEFKNRLQVACTGVLIGPRVVLTAAHCIDSIVNDRVFVALGEDAFSSLNRVKVSHLIYYKPAFWTNIESMEDLAIILLETELKDYSVNSIGHRDQIKVADQVTLIGYGFQSFEPAPDEEEYPHFGKLQILESKSLVDSIYNHQIEIISEDGTGVMSGDSGSPLIFQNKVCGVLSQGGDSYSSYVSPYYFINWINSTLPKEHNIKVDFKLEDQYPHSKTQVIPVKEFPSFNKTQCQSYRPGWDIDNEQVCWPSTQKSCELFEQEVPGEVYWNSELSVCEII